MTALDDYRRFSLTISGFGTMHAARVVAGGFDEFRLYADKAIAELEAERDAQERWMAGFKALCQEWSDKYDSLKCCGNCKRIGYETKGWMCRIDDDLYTTMPTWACIWRPSRWAERSAP